MRINCLSIDGVIYVTNNATGFDETAEQLFGIPNLPDAFMPSDNETTDQEQEVTHYLVVGNLADYWSVQNKHTNISSNNNNTEGMETSEANPLEPEAADKNAQLSAVHLAIHPVDPSSSSK
jgi:hypothetical protein